MRVRSNGQTVVSPFDQILSLQRPPIVLTAADRDRLRDLLRTAAAESPAVARFLQQEIARADVVPGGAAIASLVVMGSAVAFIEHGSVSIRRVRLVYPEDAGETGAVSVLSPLGSALLGLGPGQSIGWDDGEGRRRRLTVVDVQPPPQAGGPADEPAVGTLAGSGRS